VLFRVILYIFRVVLFIVYIFALFSVYNHCCVVSFPFYITARKYTKKIQIHENTRKIFCVVLCP
jgi:hypothetical protein